MNLKNKKTEQKAKATTAGWGLRLFFMSPLIIGFPMIYAMWQLSGAAAWVALSGLCVLVAVEIWHACRLKNRLENGKGIGGFQALLYKSSAEDVETPRIVEEGPDGTGDSELSQMEDYTQNLQGTNWKAPQPKPKFVLQAARETHTDAQIISGRVALRQAVALRLAKQAAVMQQQMQHVRGSR